MADVSLQLRELCVMFQAGDLSKSQFELAKEAVLGERSPSPVARVSVNSYASQHRTSTSTKRSTEREGWQITCPQGHGKLTYQNSNTIPECWVGRIGCSTCNNEGDASHFVGCRRCDFDLCPDCARSRSKKVSLPGSSTITSPNIMVTPPTLRNSKSVRTSSTPKKSTQHRVEYINTPPKDGRTPPVPGISNKRGLKPVPVPTPILTDPQTPATTMKIIKNNVRVQQSDNKSVDSHGESYSSSSSKISEKSERQSASSLQIKKSVPTESSQENNISEMSDASRGTQPSRSSDVNIASQHLSRGSLNKSSVASPARTTQNPILEMSDASLSNHSEISQQSSKQSKNSNSEKVFNRMSSTSLPHSTSSKKKAGNASQCSSSAAAMHQMSDASIPRTVTGSTSSRRSSKREHTSDRSSVSVSHAGSVNAMHQMSDASIPRTTGRSTSSERKSGNASQCSSSAVAMHQMSDASIPRTTGGSTSSRRSSKREHTSDRSNVSISHAGSVNAMHQMSDASIPRTTGESITRSSKQDLKESDVLSERSIPSLKNYSSVRSSKMSSMKDRSNTSVSSTEYESEGTSRLSKSQGRRTSGSTAFHSDEEDSIPIPRIESKKSILSNDTNSLRTTNVSITSNRNLVRSESVPFNFNSSQLTLYSDCDVETGRESSTACRRVSGGVGSAVLLSRPGTPPIAPKKQPSLSSLKKSSSTMYQSDDGSYPSRRRTSIRNTLPVAPHSLKISNVTISDRNSIRRSPSDQSTEGSLMIASKHTSNLNPIAAIVMGQTSQLEGSRTTESVLNSSNTSVLSVHQNNSTSSVPHRQLFKYESSSNRESCSSEEGCIVRNEGQEKTSVNYCLPVNQSRSSSVESKPHQTSSSSSSSSSSVVDESRHNQSRSSLDRNVSSRRSSKPSNVSVREAVVVPVDYSDEVNEEHNQSMSSSKGIQSAGILQEEAASEGESKYSHGRPSLSRTTSKESSRRLSTTSSTVEDQHVQDSSGDIAVISYCLPVNQSKSSSVGSKPHQTSSSSSSVVDESKHNQSRSSLDRTVSSRRSSKPSNVSVGEAVVVPVDYSDEVNEEHNQSIQSAEYCVPAVHECARSSVSLESCLSEHSTTDHIHSQSNSLKSCQSADGAATSSAGSVPEHRVRSSFDQTTSSIGSSKISKKSSITDRDNPIATAVDDEYCVPTVRSSFDQTTSSRGSSKISKKSSITDRDNPIATAVDDEYCVPTVRSSFDQTTSSRGSSKISKKSSITDRDNPIATAVDDEYCVPTVRSSFDQTTSSRGSSKISKKSSITDRDNPIATAVDDEYCVPTVRSSFDQTTSSRGSSKISKKSSITDRDNPIATAVDDEYCVPTVRSSFDQTTSSRGSSKISKKSSITDRDNPIATAVDDEYCVPTVRSSFDQTTSSRGSSKISKKSSITDRDNPIATAVDDEYCVPTVRSSFDQTTSSRGSSKISKKSSITDRDNPIATAVDDEFCVPTVRSSFDQTTSSRGSSKISKKSSITDRDNPIATAVDDEYCVPTVRSSFDQTTSSRGSSKISKKSSITDRDNPIATAVDDEYCVPTVRSSFDQTTSSRGSSKISKKSSITDRDNPIATAVDDEYCVPTVRSSFDQTTSSRGSSKISKKSSITDRDNPIATAVDDEFCVPTVRSSFDQTTSSRGSSKISKKSSISEVQSDVMSSESRGSCKKDSNLSNTSDNGRVVLYDNEEQVCYNSNSSLSSVADSDYRRQSAVSYSDTVSITDQHIVVDPVGDISVRESISTSNDEQPSDGEFDNLNSSHSQNQTSITRYGTVEQTSAVYMNKSLSKMTSLYDEDTATEYFPEQAETTFSPGWNPQIRSREQVPITDIANRMKKSQHRPVTDRCLPPSQRLVSYNKQIEVASKRTVTKQQNTSPSSICSIKQPPPRQHVGGPSAPNQKNLTK